MAVRRGNELDELRKQLEERIRTLDHDMHEQVKFALEQQRNEQVDELKEKLRTVESRCEELETSREELEKSREEAEGSVKKEQERYEQLRTELWEKERQLQELREEKLQRMLENGNEVR